MIDSLLSNRILRAFETAKAAVDKMDEKTRKLADEKTVLEFDEYCRFQDLKSEAQASERITFEEASSLYAVLGGTHTHFNKQPLHLRMVGLLVFQELLKAKIASLR